MRRLDVPVLVVGAGPVGLTTSLLLAGLGIDNRVVDRRDGPHRAPQAHVVNPRSLEIFRALGIDAAALRAVATPREQASHVRWVTKLGGRELGCLPYERQGDECLAYTPTPLLNLSQHLLEPILVEHLRGRGGAEVHYHHSWIALEQDADGVTSRIDDLSLGRSYEVRSRYVLAADGAGSGVRRSLGGEMIGPERLQSFVMIHVEADLRALVGERPAILYWVSDPECPGNFVAHDAARTWVFMHPYDPETESRDDYTHSVCAGIVRRALARDDFDLVVRNVSTWTMTAQIADRYAFERVFLVGDSAHRFPPSGGLGMNTGIQDAHNLVWKLSAVERGRAPATLLGTYESERRPVAQSNADQSMVNAMKMIEVLDALGVPLGGSASRDRYEQVIGDPDALARVRAAIENQRDHFDMLGLQLGFRYESGALVPDGSSPPTIANPTGDFVPTARPGSRLPHAWIERDGARISALDLVPYDGFTLLAGGRGSAWDDATAGVADAPVRCLVAGRDFTDPGDRWASLCEIAGDGAVLVRPDQHVAWRARMTPANPRATLAAALKKILPPRP